MAEIENNKPEAINAFFLPILSDNSPANDTPAIHPTKADETNQPSIAASSANFDFTKPIVPEITAVS